MRNSMYPHGLSSQEILHLEHIEDPKDVSKSMLTSSSKVLLMSNFHELKNSIKRGIIGGAPWVFIITDGEEQEVRDFGLLKLAQFLKFRYKFVTLKDIQFETRVGSLLQKKTEEGYSFELDGEPVEPRIALLAFYLEEKNMDVYTMSLSLQCDFTREAVSALGRHI